MKFITKGTPVPTGNGGDDVGCIILIILGVLGIVAIATYSWFESIGAPDIFWLIVFTIITGMWGGWIAITELKEWSEYHQDWWGDWCIIPWLLGIFAAITAFIAIIFISEFIVNGAQNSPTTIRIILSIALIIFICIDIALTPHITIPILGACCILTGLYYSLIANRLITGLSLIAIPILLCTYLMY